MEIHSLNKNGMISIPNEAGAPVPVALESVCRSSGTLDQGDAIVTPGMQPHPIIRAILPAYIFETRDRATPMKVALLDQLDPERKISLFITDAGKISLRGDCVAANKNNVLAVDWHLAAHDMGIGDWKMVYGHFDDAPDQSLLFLVPRDFVTDASLPGKHKCLITDDGFVMGLSLEGPMGPRGYVGPKSTYLLAEEGQTLTAREKHLCDIGVEMTIYADERPNPVAAYLPPLGAKALTFNR